MPSLQLVNINVVLLCCIVVLSSVLCSSACFVLQWFHHSARFLSHLRSLLSFFSLVFAWPRLALSCHVLFCSCLFRRGRPARVDRRAGGRSVGQAVGRSSGGRSGGGAGRRSAGVRADGRAGVVFSPRFLRVVFCKSFFLSRRSALRVSPAETRLTVYRRLSILLRSDRPSSGVREDR